MTTTTTIVAGFALDHDGATCGDRMASTPIDNVTAHAVPPSPLSSQDDQSYIVKRVGRRLMWYLAALYFVSVLDRGNLGFAALTMNRDLHLTPEMYSTGVGILFLGYALFEVPSNLILARFGARVTLTRIAILFGLATMLMAFVAGPLGFYSIRGLLGLAEAGLTPGVFLYLSFWIPASYRARYNAVFSYAIPCAYVFAYLISGQIVRLDGSFNLPGWKWLFLLEGLPAVALGIFGIFYLTNRPRDAKWLSQPERTWLEDRIAGERQVVSVHGLGSIGEVLRNPIMIVLSIVYIGVFCGNACLAPWLPPLLKQNGIALNLIGWIAAIPPATGVIGMYFLCRRSDQRNERVYHTLFAMLIAALGFGLVAMSNSALLAVLGFMLANIGVYSSLAIFWSIPQTFLPPATKPAAIAVISSFGALLGGWVAPLAIGKVQTAQHVVSGVFLACGLVLWLASKPIQRMLGGSLAVDAAV
jgi:ACS family tartrate transporter-like MFS transporter